MRIQNLFQGSVGGRSTRGRGPTTVRAWLLVGAVLPGALLVGAPRPCHAQGMAGPRPEPGMALTPPGPGMAGGTVQPPDAVPDTERKAPEVQPRRRPLAGLGAPPAPAGGSLPNQRTGHRREHVVRDICIGC